MIYRSIKSAERTLALFELFSAHQRPLTVGEIARLLEIPQPSVTMLVRNLVGLGYLEQDRFARTYTPTIRIALLGSWIHQRFTHDRQLELRLDSLQKAVDETTFIGLQNGAHVQYILFIRPNAPHGFDVQAEMLRPLAVSAVGKALLSIKPDAEVRALVQRANAEALEPRHRVDVRTFMSNLEAIRLNGYAETAGEVREGVATIAMPTPPLVGRSPTAVAVGGQLDRIREKKPLILRELAKFVDTLTAETSTAPQED
jgi:DNA-binding IclR family transcriptional regulator